MSFDAEKFWSRDDRSGGQAACWPWLGARFPATGYGAVRYGARTQNAARVAYLLARGPIPPGFQVDHLCRWRPCCNPTHIEAVAQRENILRGTSWAAANASKTHCPQGHPYLAANTMLRRERFGRECRLCKRARNNAAGRRRRRAAALRQHAV
jgi:hypothetical protein